MNLQVEFELDTDIQDAEAVRLLGEDAGIERGRKARTERAGGGGNVLRLDEEDYVHKIDDAFTAQQMVPNTSIRVDRATLRRMKQSEVRGLPGGRNRRFQSGGGGLNG